MKAKGRNAEKIELLLQLEEAKDTATSGSAGHLKRSELRTKECMRLLQLNVQHYFDSPVDSIVSLMPEADPL